jgi:hypothetical protein
VSFPTRFGQGRRWFASAPELPSAGPSMILGENLPGGPEPDVSFIVGSLTVDRVGAKPADRGARLLWPTCKYVIVMYRAN